MEAKTRAKRRTGIPYNNPAMARRKCKSYLLLALSPRIGTERMERERKYVQSKPHQVIDPVTLEWER